MTMTMSDGEPATHRGWFWFCPVIAVLDDERPDDIAVEARWACLEWLFDFAEVFESLRITLSQLTIDGYEPTFMFKLRRINRVE